MARGECCAQEAKRRQPHGDAPDAQLPDQPLTQLPQFLLEAAVVGQNTLRPREHPLTLDDALAHLSTPPYARTRLQLDLKRRGSETGLLAEIGAFWRLFFVRAFDPYRPELHYMRGPGPACRAKLKASSHRRSA